MGLAALSSKRKKQGIVILLTAVMLLMLIPVVGLAIDATVLYSLKAKLVTATDAAALGAARSLNNGLTLAAQETSARNRALAVFAANFPSNSYYTRNNSVTVAVAENGYKTRTVTVNSQLTAPTYFMRMMGLTSTTVKASGQASRRDVNLMLVLDRSGSMAGTPCTTMKANAVTFSNMFSEGRDNMGMVLFSTGYLVGYSPSKNFKTSSPTLATQINNIGCAGGTSTGMAMWQAYQLIKNINEPGALNLILLFTDGYPNAITADFPVKKATDTRLGIENGSNTGYKQWNNTAHAFSGSTVCTSDASTCSMEPSPCKDAAGNSWDRNNGQSNRTYNTTSPFNGPWNPNWNPAPLRGVFTQAAGDQYNLTTGTTHGLYAYTGSTVANGNEVVIATPANCAMGGSYPGSVASGLPAGRRDMAYVPEQDIYGNNADGYKSIAPRYSGGTYDGKIKVDVPKIATGVGFNVLDSAASRIRADDTYKPVIFAIGLGSNGGVDNEVLLRVTNDPDSPIYTSTRAAGLYIYSPTLTDLAAAFNRIASEILRLAM